MTIPFDTSEPGHAGLNNIFYKCRCLVSYEQLPKMLLAILGDQHRLQTSIQFIFGNAVILQCSDRYR